jgi:hypothetical protein
MRATRFLGLTALVAALAVPVGFPAPAAAASVTGSVTFQCTAHLPAWPSPENAGTCTNGVIPARGVVTLAGRTDSGVAYSVDGAGQFSAAFTYETACVAGEPPLTGNAWGTAEIRGVPAVYGGAVTTADVTVTFTWVRAGAAATILVTDWDVDLLGRETVGGTSGAGEATFVPVLTLADTCPYGGFMEASVQGEVIAVL